MRGVYCCKLLFQLLGNQTIGFVEIISFDHDDVDKSSFTSSKLSKRKVNFYFGLARAICSRCCVVVVL